MLLVLRSCFNLIVNSSLQGGNDYEIYSDSRTIGHTVKNPSDTMERLKEVFDL